MLSPLKGSFEMSGSFLLDTNAIIQLLKGNESVFRIIENADFLACSIS